MRVDTPTPKKALISYSHKDESFRSDLIAALATAVRANELEVWSDHCLLPGQNLDEEILSQLNEADVILLLVSPDFIASDYCFRKELQIALERHRNGRAVVVPVVIRPTDWAGAPFTHLMMLPYDAKPVSTWSNADEAWLNVAQSLRRLIGQLATSELEPKPFRSKALKQRLADTFDYLQSRYVDPKAGPGSYFGLSALDALSDGVWPGEVALIAGRPDHGNVELALAAITSQVGAKRKVYVLSQRSSAPQLTNRLICGLGLVSRARFIRGELEDDDWARVTGVIRLLREADITIDDDPVRSVGALKVKLAELAGQGYALLVVEGVEYLNSGHQEREIALCLSDFAKANKLAVISTVMVSPSAERRAQGRPLLADLGVWREFENYADKIIVAFRSLDSTFGLSTTLSNSVEVTLVKSPDGHNGLAELAMHSSSGMLYDPTSLTDPPAAQLP